MKYLWLFLILPAVLGQANFGNSYLKNTRLCHHWSCINTRLGFSDTLPIRSVAENAFKRVLPEGAWQNVINKILDNCYGNRTRRYTNTCPGQALLHCVVDEMINNCPEDSLQKDDACSPVSSLAGLRHMFSQSRYHNLEKNLPQEQRPEWFMKHYFEQKCCNLPAIFNTATLETCGFSTFMNYYDHEPRPMNSNGAYQKPQSIAPQYNGDTLKVVALDQTEKSTLDSNVDPLECCDIKEFIQPSWRSECDFHLNWKGHERLVIANNTFGLTTEAPAPTTTVSPNAPKDVILLPHSCEKETCLFKNLDIIDEAGTIKTAAYISMLTNLTEFNPHWNKAVGRAITKCLTRRSRRYDYDCEINKIVSCTLDVLSENCPYKRKSDDKCRHNKIKGGCQISSSKYSPKYRREVCLLPQMIHKDTLNQCGLDTFYEVHHVVITPPKPRKYGWSQFPYICQDQKPSTTCIMTKMGILNKYKFMDYFRMKDKIRQFTANQPEWSALLDIYMSAFVNIPMYGEHCGSQKKLLNVVDAMLMTCPVSKRVNTPQCTKFFKDITDTTPLDNHNVTKQKLDEIMKHYNHIFLPIQARLPKFSRVIRKKHSMVHRKPTYNYGVLDSKNTPQVKTIDIKPVVITRLDRPLVLAPVYLRDPKLATPFHNDGIFRNNPYWLHDRTAEAHVTTPNTNTIIHPLYNKQVITTPMNPPPTIEPIDSPFRMIKPE